ncbi:MAG: SCO family protein [Anaerolineae bacterium]|nr:SCO family protein [Anaerolineae bacterium]
MRKNQALVITLLFMTLLIAACGGSASTVNTPSPTAEPTQQISQPGAEGITVIAPPIKVSDFTLTNQTGTEAHLRDYQGNLVLFAFGYTHCPDVCPVTLARFKQIKDRLGESAAQVTVAFITVDGFRDTPERLNEYLKIFDPAFVGLTGSEELTREVIKEYGGQFIINDTEGLRKNYTVDHTASSFLLDADGQWIRTYEYNTDPDIVVADILSVLGVSAPTT